MGVLGRLVHDAAGGQCHPSEERHVAARFHRNDSMPALSVWCRQEAQRILTELWSLVAAAAAAADGQDDRQSGRRTLQRLKQREKDNNVEVDCFHPAESLRLLLLLQLGREKQQLRKRRSKGLDFLLVGSERRRRETGVSKRRFDRRSSGFMKTAAEMQKKLN